LKEIANLPRGELGPSLISKLSKISSLSLMKTFLKMVRSVPRFFLFVSLILAIENTLVVQIAHPWFVIYLYRGIPIVFGLSLLFLGRRRLRSLGPEYFSISIPFVSIHLVALCLFICLELFLRRFYVVDGALTLHVAVGLWILLIPVLVISLLGAFIPLHRLAMIGRLLGPAWAYAGLCSALVVIFREYLRVSWDVPNSRVGHFLQVAAFSQARTLLTLFYPVVIAEPRSHVLGTDRFSVEISATCSGIEGLALVLAFMVVWFIFARRELRIGRALLLFPVALALMWVLNLARLVALVSMGSAGFQETAIQGFHSEAGWISFVVVSLGFLLVAQQITWFRRDHAALDPKDDVDVKRSMERSRNLAVIYLSPFMAITVASLIGQTVSGGPDALYPLRFIAASMFLWIYRAEYAKSDWRFGSLGIVAGIAVAGIWLTVHFSMIGWRAAPTPPGALFTDLSKLSEVERVSWIFVRALAAITTVPIAEELAFRGYLARRIVGVDVESVKFSQLSVASIAVSSIAFGLMHGSMWAPGIVAGIIFAVVARLRNRVGEAVAAHVVANSILAVVALILKDYTIW
jgi:exosortase E/protease (VPEID-CTERM system)